MFEIKPLTLPENYVACWRAAGGHLDRQVEGGIQSWLNASLHSPSPEQFSFRLGNQLFFVRLEIGDWRWEVPGSLESVIELAEEARGHACLMPMACTMNGWQPIYPGWGLIDAKTHRPIQPHHLVSDALVEMSDWELHDFAVYVVTSQLRRQGHKIASWTGHLDISPSIWLESDRGSEWVIVRAARFPQSQAPIPRDLDVIAERCRREGRIGHFASVILANGSQSYDQDRPVPVVPLYRGHGMHVQFSGLTPISHVKAH